jgi:YD repeat-containing protein
MRNLSNAFCACLAVLVVSLCGGGASAQQTNGVSCYTYDALGRVVTATDGAGSATTPCQSTNGTNGAIANSVNGDTTASTTYTFDAPGNRTQVAPAFSGLLTGQVLGVGQSLVVTNSTTGVKYTLLMQTDSNLVLYAGSTASWASNTSTGSNPANPAPFAQIGTDGRLRVWSGLGGSNLWTSDNFVGVGDHLLLQTDGNLVLYDTSHVARWASATASITKPDRLQSGQALIPGQELLSAANSSGQNIWALQVQTSGAVTIVCVRTQQVTWTVPTSSNPAYIQMLSTGSVYASGSSGNVWPSSSPYQLTSAVSGSYLLMQGDGNLVVYAPNGTPTWASGTGGQTSC